MLPVARKHPKRRLQLSSIHIRRPIQELNPHRSTHLTTSPRPILTLTTHSLTPTPTLTISTTPSPPATPSQRSIIITTTAQVPAVPPTPNPHQHLPQPRINNPHRPRRIRPKPQSGPELGRVRRLLVEGVGYTPAGEGYREGGACYAGADYCYVWSLALCWCGV